MGINLELVIASNGSVAIIDGNQNNKVVYPPNLSLREYMKTGIKCTLPILKTNLSLNTQINNSPNNIKNREAEIKQFAPHLILKENKKLKQLISNFQKIIEEKVIPSLEFNANGNFYSNVEEISTGKPNSEYLAKIALSAIYDSGFLKKL